MTLPTANEFFGAPKAPALPSADEFFSGGKPTADEFFGTQEGVGTKVVKFFTGGKDDVDPATGQPRLTARRLGGGVVESIGEGMKDVVPGLRASKVIDEAFFRDMPDSHLEKWHMGGANPALERVKELQGQGMELGPAVRQAGIEHSRKVQQGYKETEASLDQQYPQDPAYKGKTSGLIESGISGVAGSLPAMALAPVPGVGPALSIGLMTAQQAGQTFKEHEEAGADPERAARGALGSAIVQAPIEYLGNMVQLKALGNALKKNPLGLRFLDLGKSGLAEGIENTLQGIPEDIANVWIKNPDKTLAESVQIAAQDPEKFQRSWERFASGVIGGMALTGTGQAVGAGVRKITGQGKEQAQPQAPTGAESLHAVGDNQDAAYMAKVGRAEYGDGSKYKNDNSSASGQYQFVDKTWAGLVNSPEGKAAGLTVDGRTDPVQQAAAMSIFTAKNREALTKALGRAPNDAELYTAHFLGSGGATQFLGALQASPDDMAINHVSPEASRANQEVFYEGRRENGKFIPGRPRTVAEVASLLAGKVGQGEVVARPGVKSDVFDAVAQQEQPEGAFGPVRPELASLREDIQSRSQQEVQRGQEEAQAETLLGNDPWNVVSVQDAASQDAGVQLHMARENELRSLRAEIQARDVRQRAREEQGMPAPVQQAQRIESSLALPPGTPPPVDGGARSQVIPTIPLQGQQVPALPQGQGFETVGKPFTPKESAPADSRAWIREQQRLAKNEAADPITSFIWGRLAKKGVDASTGKALLAKFGPGIFAPKGKGVSLDVLTEELNSTGRPVPENFGGDPLASYLLDRGTSAKMARKKFMESARAEAARMDNEMMRMARDTRQEGRIEFRPGASYGANVLGPVGGLSSIREAYNPDTMMGPEDVPFSASSRRGVTSLSTRTVAQATASYERAMPGAAPTRILQSGQDLPAHIQEQARSRGYSLGQIRGVHDPKTGSVYLVADNLIDGAEAGRIWLHEQLAHHGLRELFGRSAKFQAVLESVRKSYGYETTRQAEEHIAEIAEQLDAGKALKPADGFHWRKLVDAVRSWLAEHGISVTRANLEAMLRRSARNLAKGADAQGRGMQEAAAFSQEREGMFSLREDTDAALPKLAASTDLGFFSRFLRTPEYQKHPVHKELYEIFRNRHERAHEIINSVMGDGQEASPIQAYDALTEKEQLLLDDAFTIADERFIGPEKMEKWFKDQGIGERVVAVWRKMRRGYDRMLDHMLEGSIQELEKGNNPDVSYVDAAGKTVTMSLRDAVNEMRSLQGTYAPRIRPDGTYAVLAKRTDSEGNVEYARHHVEWQRQAGPVAKKLTAEGWTVTGFQRISRLPEGVQQDLAKDMSSMAGAIGNAAQNMKNVTDEVRQEFITNLVSEVANEIKSRGLRSSTIRRTGKFGRSVKGYETNSKKRFAEYTTRTAFGIAKKESAQKALAALFAMDADGKLLLSPSENPNAFSYAQAFIKEMLRNSEKADRVIGLAKSIATFKFMGFNPKSAALNLTTLVTQAPPALRVYATDSKAGLLKCTKYMIGASDDAVKFMLGKDGKGLTAGEKDFLGQIRRKELDAPQETRALSQVNASTVGKAWSESMSKAMLMFGATEQFNRVSTLLAGYRLAIDAGYSHAEAMERAQLASDRAHGAYGREAMPEFTWGTGVGGRIGQLFYVYQKYTHNTYQLLTEVAGKRDARSFMMLLATPVILAGDKAGTTWLAWTVYNQFMKLISDDDREPREKLLTWIKDNLGGQAEDLVRFGIFGLLGVDVSGSMSSKVNVPTGPVELAGAVGGFVKDYLGPGGVVHLLATGQPGKALEKALPTGLSKPFQAVRESVQGITDGKGHPLLDEQGKPYMPTSEETTAKMLGFRPAREARVRDIRSAAMAEERTFQDRRTSIFEEYRAWVNGGRNPDALDSVVGKVREFNADVDRMDRPNISPITPRSLESQLVRMESPSKKELGRMGIGEAAQVPELTNKEFAQAEARAAFKIEAKRINAAVEAYNEAQKAGNTAEAMRISKENDLARMRSPVKFTSERLSKINAARNMLDANTKIDPATRDRWVRRYDEQEARVLETFRKRYGGRK